MYLMACVPIKDSGEPAQIALLAVSSEDSQGCRVFSVGQQRLIASSGLSHC